MKTTFLSAAVPLTKTFSRNALGELEKHSHPRVIEYTSHTLEVPSIQAFHAQILEHAKRSHCLLKGNVARPLKEESRAGTTDGNAPTEWVCFDLDGAKGFTDVDEFLRTLGLHDVDCIVQYSASMGVVPDKGLSAHVFMLLTRPAMPAVLKQWLMHLNLTVTQLRDFVGLTKTNNALLWTLDVSTCQNDKLIYIAPPLLGKGVKDEFKGERIQLRLGRKRGLSLDEGAFNTENNRVEAEKLLNDLRARASLPARKKWTFRTKNNVEYLSKPDTATVSGIKQDRGFVYLNLNGGDSWGYYHPEDNPTFIFNFKGEPIYRTEELLPDYWNSLRRNNAPANQDELILAFRDFRTATYWNGRFDRNSQTLKLAPAKSKEQLKDFLKANNQFVPDHFEDWNVAFNPSGNFIVDEDAREVNLFQPSTYMRLVPKVRTTVPPMVARVFQHALADDGEIYEHFLNWLACIMQYRQRTMTAWVMHGIPGTGKGIMLNRVLVPLFGREYVVSKRMSELDSQFNAYMEQALILFIDEAQLSSFERRNPMEANLKNFIVEPTISIRRMHTSPYMAQNYMNLIFASNKRDPVSIDDRDRRYNVGNFQPEKLTPTDAELSQLDIELTDFYYYLMSREADQDRARTALQTDSKREVVHLSRTSVDEVSDAVMGGDVQYLLDQVHDNPASLPVFQAQRAMTYETLVRRIAETKPKALSREELFVIFDWCVGNMPTAPTKFTSLLKHHSINVTPVYLDSKVVRGIKTTWTTPLSSVLPMGASTSSEPVPANSKEPASRKSPPQQEPQPQRSSTPPTKASKKSPSSKAASTKP